MMPLVAEPLSPTLEARCSVSETNVDKNAATDIATGCVPSTGPSAPIHVLSKLALRDAVLELEATVRRTRDASSAAVLQLRNSAERQLGVEVEIEDPALRGLFALHVVAVEELCARIRSQADAALAAVEAWGQASFAASAEGFRFLFEIDFGGGSDIGATMTADLTASDRDAKAARERLCMRIRNEVHVPIDERLRVHARLRDALRDRRRTISAQAASRRDVAWLRKGNIAGASGLRSLSGRQTGGTQLEDAELRHANAMQQLSEADTHLLSSFSDLQEHSVDAVRGPWAALLQIQAEFFLAQQAIWVPLGDVFSEIATTSRDTAREAQALDGTTLRPIG
eukprot:TRINITY_DN62243_c0_g1_i1.p1 TRINITY_DN62243_c0_g1~~TRINITY_DN62243_c0_g1_i1.p1  ORF type:complete len:340 (+),score=65.30 TRINITY_DN62243_c0_g1_i1:76-1095(+)